MALFMIGPDGKSNIKGKVSKIKTVIHMTLVTNLPSEEVKIFLIFLLIPSVGFHHAGNIPFLLQNQTVK